VLLQLNSLEYDVPGSNLSRFNHDEQLQWDGPVL